MVSRHGLARAAFDRYIGIDYSGAKKPTSKLTGLQVYEGTVEAVPVKALMSPGARDHWTRRGVAEWLAEQLRNAPRSLVGIDHGFSFPIEYFKGHGIEQSWPLFLEDFCRHWPTGLDDVTVRFVRDGGAGNCLERKGEANWKRLTERRTRSAKSVFHFDVPGVANSTHAGLPWLRYIRDQVGDRVHFWPFDGWAIPEGKSAVVEVYPSLWSAIYAPEQRTPDEHDAFVSAAWMREADLAGSLPRFFNPLLNEEERRQANVEGWILGVGIKP